MRIISGNFRHRVIKTLATDATRPTTDRVREAVFSRIGPYFDKGFILDLFSGSGAVSLEAISRGYDRAVMNDKSRQACDIIRQNIAALDVRDNCELWNLDFRSALKKAGEQGYQFDLIYSDAPYKLNVETEIADTIIQYNLLKDNGLIIFETDKNQKVEVTEPLYVEKEASYGISKITYVRKGNQ